MKQQHIALFAVLALVLAGCGPVAENSPPAETALPPGETVSVQPSAVPLVTAEPTALPSPVAEMTGRETTTPEPTARPDPTLPEEPVPETPIPVPERPSDEVVLAAYRDAAEAYAWFAGYDDSALLLDGTDSRVWPVGEGEITLYRVGRPGLDSMDALRGYLKSLFSDEVIDGLLASETICFAESEEGGLYARPAGRGADVTKGAVTLEVLWPSEGEPVLCTVQARVERLEEDGESGLVPVGEQIYQFPYQKVGEKWVFTWFTSIF